MDLYPDCPNEIEKSWKTPTFRVIPISFEASWDRLPAAKFPNGIVPAVSAKRHEVASSKRELSTLLPSPPTNADGYW